MSGRNGRNFEKGDFVVYPSHGAGCIEGIAEKTVGGEKRRYYVVRIPDSELTLTIPVEGETTLRPCAGEADLEGALRILRARVTDMPSNWNHRIKHNQGKIKTGEIYEVAEVVRNLTVYSAERGLSTGERNMLAKARQILASEVALVRGIDLREAESLINEALSEGTKGSAS